MHTHTQTHTYAVAYYTCRLMATLFKTYKSKYSLFPHDFFLVCVCVYAAFFSVAIALLYKRRSWLVKCAYREAADAKRAHCHRQLVDLLMHMLRGVAPCQNKAFVYTCGCK